MADKKAQLIIEGAAPVELPILTGTVGPDVIDVQGFGESFSANISAVYAFYSASAMSY